MQEETTVAQRVIIISDLHLGGTQPFMMSRPNSLASFIKSLPSLTQPDELLQLVLAGDIIDFLSIRPYRSWTPCPGEAVRKLSTLTDLCSPFRPIIDALGRHVQSGYELTLMLGNHDLEFALPQVQDAWLAAMGVPPRSVNFLCDGHALRLGDVLIEHGNRYDGANQNDWDNLRAIASARSRNEKPQMTLDVSVGSAIVEHVVNKLKRYPFINLLQPEGPLTAMLLLAFEPQLKWHWGKIAKLLEGMYAQSQTRDGRPPAETTNVAFIPEYDPDPDLLAAFGEDYALLRQPPEEVSLRSFFTDRLGTKRTSLSELLDSGDRVDPQRLQKIRVAMRKMLMDDQSFALNGPTEQYGLAAERLRELGATVVVMGHTHLARHIGNAQRADYINTGTWADVISVPPEVLADGADAELTDFLRRLKNDDRVRSWRYTYADLRIEANGQTSRATLEDYRV